MDGLCVRYTGPDLPSIGVKNGMNFNEVVVKLKAAIDSGITTTTTSTSTTTTTSSTTTTTTTLFTVPVTVGYLGLTNVNSLQVQLLQGGDVKGNVTINNPSGSNFTKLNMIPGVYDIKAIVNLLNNQRIIEFSSTSITPGVEDSFVSSIDRTYTNRLITNPSQLVLSDLGNTTTTSTTTTTTTTAPPSTTTTTSSSTTSTSTTSSTTTTTTTQLTTTTTSTSTTTTSTSSTTTTTSTNGGGSQIFTITGTNNTLSVDGSVYPCGSTIWLEGTFKALEFTNLNGCSGNRINITNKPAQVTVIGDPNWSSGGWSTALAFRNCHHFNLFGSSKTSFVVSGSTTVNRTSYFNLALVGLSDNFDVYNITVENGGTGVYAKTEPVPGNTQTYDPVGGPYTYLNNFKFHDIDIKNTYNEGTYIGHTGPYWDLTSNSQFNGNQSQFNPTHQYAEPKRLNNVEIYNIYIEGSGADGMQTAAAENMTIHHVEIYNWATRTDPNHCGGLLIGGKCRNVDAYCVYVHDGWGEMLQVSSADGSDGSFVRIHNCLFKNNYINNGGNDGCTFKGTNGLAVEFYDNTVVQSGGNSLRFYTGCCHLLNRNILIQPRMAGGTISSRAYIYDEPGVTWIEGTGSNANGKYPDIATANVNASNWYAPNPGSPATGKGYVRGLCDGSSTTTTSTSSTSTSTTSSTTTTTTTVATTTTTSTSTSSTSTTSTSTTSSTTTSTTTVIGTASFTKVNNWWPSNLSGQYGWLYLPADYNPSGPALPFTIFLHGQGETGTGSGNGGVNDLLIAGPPKFLNAGDRPTGMVIFCPQTSINTWEPNWVEAARSFMVSNYNVDPNRFYLTGLSLGGSGTAKYVSQNPDKVAAFLIATGDTQFIRNGAEDDVINGIRICDVPGWFHAGVADSTISFNNGISVMLAANALSPKPKYPFLVNTYWGKGHTAALWDDEVYNRKNRTDTTGTAAFDWIEWFKRFKVNDLTFNATSHVVVAENKLSVSKTDAWTDYRIALRLVNLMSSGTDKTNLLNRLADVKSSIQSDWRVVELSFGSTAVSGVNNLASVNDNQSINNMNDISGSATTIDFTLNATVWDGQVNIGTNNEYLGMPTSFWANGWRIYNISANTCTFAGFNSGSTKVIRFLYGDMTQVNTTHYGARVTINGVTKDLENEIVNTNKYVDFTIPSGSSSFSATLQPIVAAQQGDVAGVIIFESISTSTTTTTSTSSTSTTTTTSSSTTTTTTTAGPTTTTTSTSTTSTTSTTTTSTSSTTTTTTTVAPGIAQFNFNSTAQSVAGWTDVTGSPSSSIVTATHTGTGIGISSIATNRWGAFGGTSSNNTNGPIGSNAEFPADVLISFWFSYALVSATNQSNIEINGLTPGGTYDIHVIGGRSSTAGSGIPVGQNRLMEWKCTDNAGTQTVTDYATRDNTTNIQVFSGKVADGSGKIIIGIFQDADGDAINGDQFAYINGMRVIPS
jgi:hypothetical protein